MLRFVEFRGLIQHPDRFDLKPRTKKGTIEALGKHTGAFFDAFVRHTEMFHAHHGAKVPSKHYDSFPAWFEHQIKLGALAASVAPAGRMHDIGCGVAIPSIVFAHLTGQEAVAIDTDPAALRIAQQLASRLGVSTVRFVPVDYNAFDPAALSASDLLFVSDPMPDMVQAFRDLALSTRASVLLNMAPTHIRPMLIDGLDPARLIEFIRPFLARLIRLAGYDEALLMKTEYVPAQFVFVGKRGSLISA